MTITANPTPTDNIHFTLQASNKDQLIVTPTTIRLSATTPQATVTIDVIDDNNAQTTQTYTIEINIPDNVRAQPSSELSVVVPANDTPTVSFSQATITTLEHETAQITLQVSPPPSEDIAVFLDLVGGTLDPNDIPTLPTTLTIAQGQTSINIDITPQNDIEPEPEESATITLAIASGFAQTSTNNRLILTVLASDQENSIELSPTQILISEGQTSTLRLSAINLNQATTLTLTSSHATQLQLLPHSSTELSNATTTLQLALSASTQRQTRTITIYAIDDTQAELEQTYLITATAQTTSNKTILINNNPDLSTITVTVEQNDAPIITATLNPTLITEGTTATLTLTATALPATTATVMLMIADTDERIVLSTNKVTISPNQLTSTVTIHINDDQRYQPQTKGAIILQADNLIQLATTTIDFTIAANDTPTISIQVNPPSLTEGATVTLTLTTNNAPNKDVTIDLTTITPDARIILPPSITLKEGETTASILLPITDDNIPQQASTYTIMLTIADNSGFAQLNNNEVSFTIEADNDLYLIGFIPSKVTLKEGTTIQATITATPNTQQDITLMLASENTQQLTISPTTVTLSADAPSKPIIIQAIADTQQESTEVYQVSIAVPTNTPAIVTTPLVVTIPPSQAPAITAQLDQNEINEGDQTFLTLIPNGILPTPTTITLTTTDSLTFDRSIVVFTDQRRQKVAVMATNDDIFSLLRYRQAMITLAASPTDVMVSTTQLTVTIIENDLNQISFTDKDITLREGEQYTATITVTPAAATTFTVMLSHTGEDQLMLSTDTITIAQDTTESTLIITAIDDNKTESTENYTIRIDIPDNIAAQTTTPLTVIILPSDPAAMITAQLSTTTLVEGDQTFLTLTANGILPIPTTITLTTIGDITVGNAEIVLTTNGMTTVAVTANNDDIVMAAQRAATITLAVTPDTVDLPTTQLTITIEEDDLYLIGFIPSKVTLKEGASTTVTITANPTPTDNIHFTLQASNKDQLIVTPTTIRLSATTPQATVTIDVIDDNNAQTTQTYTIEINIPDNVRAQPSSELSVVVPANDTPTVSFSQATITTLEHETAQITLQVSPPPSEDIAVFLDLVGGTLDPNDIPTLPTTLTIAQGQTSINIDITPQNDIEPEPEESATITLAIASGFAQTSTNNRLILTVLASDQENSIELSPTQILISEGQTSTLRLSAINLNQATTLTLTSSHATQLQLLPHSSTELSNATTTLQLALSASTQRQTRTITIYAIDDTQAELEQTYLITATAQTTSNKTILINNNPDLSTITVTVEQNDAPIITATLNPTLITEGTTATLTLTATALPATTATVMLMIADTDERIVLSTNKVTISPNQLTSTVTIHINDDQRYQPQTKGAIILQADNLIQLATTTIDFTIAANDTPTITATIRPPSLTEGATVTLTLTTNNAPNKDVTIDLTTITPDARIILPPSITLKEGETTASILLPITDDNIPQQASTYTIMLTIADNSGFAQLNNNEVSFTIEADNDLYLIGFIPSKVTLKEGTTIQATITATPNTQQDITLMLASENTQQLTISPTTVTLSADAPSKPIIIQAIADTQQESTEVYQVSIAVPTNTPAIVTTPLVVTIPPSQAPAITAQLDQNEINEGDQTFLTLTANGILPIPTTITLTTIGDITVGNAEIVLTTNGMTTVAVTANNDDIVMAAQRAATITLAVTPDTVDLPTTQLTITIEEDDLYLIGFIPSKVTLKEGASTTVTITANPTPTDNIHFTLQASNKDQLIVTPTTIRLSATTPQATVTIDVIDDNNAQTTQTYTIEINIPDNVRAQPSSELSVVVPANDTPTVSFSQATITTLEHETAQITLQVSPPPSEDIAVFLDLVGGTLDPNDIPTLPTTLTIAQGQTSINIDITPQNDIEPEPEESATITLAIASGFAQTSTNNRLILTVLASDQENSIELSPTQILISEGQTSTLRLSAINLNQATTLTLTSSHATQLQLLPHSSTELSNATTTLQLALSASTQRQTRTITIYAIDDTQAELEQTYLITATAQTATTKRININNNPDLSTITVTVEQNDAPIITATLNPTLITEGTTATLTLTATALPATTATVMLMIADTDERIVLSTNKVTISPNQLTSTATIHINDDQRYQPQTKGAIVLQADNLIQLATTTIDFTIAANDTPTISIQVNPPSLTEGATVTLTLTTNNAPNKDVTIDLTTITPDARIILPPSITLKEGETTASILLPITDDNIPQQASTYTIMLTIADNSGFAQLNNNEVSFTIEADNDLYLIGFIPSKVTLKEGTTIQATITATPNTQQDITLMLASENTQQLTISPTTVTLSADAPSKPIIIQAIADTQQESTEVYQVSIAVPTNTPAIVTTPLVVTIPPSQAPAITAQLDQNEINEGDQTFLTLTANGILPIPTTITLTTIGDITVGNAEIVLTTNGMTTVAVTANNDDIVMAAQRAATITLAVTPDTVDLPTTQLTITIEEDDLYLIGFIPSKVTLKEGASTTVTITANPTPTDNIHFTLQASNKDQLIVTPTTIRLSATTPQATVTIDVIDDNNAQTTQTYTIEINIPDNVRAQPSSELSVVVPANDTPTVSFSQATITTLEHETAQITLQVSPPPSEDIAVFLDLVGGTLDPNDIPTLPTTLTIAQGQTSINIDITPQNDIEPEPEESATITLAIASGFAQTSTNNRLILTVLASDQENSIELSPTQILISEGQTSTLRLSAINLNQATTLTLTSSHATQLQLLPHSSTELSNATTTLQLALSASTQRQTRTITIYAIDDTQAELEQTYLITATAQTTSNKTILINNNPDLSTITVTVEQNDAPIITATLNPTLITEGTTATLTLTATALPATTATVMLMIADTDERIVLSTNKVTISPNQLTSTATIHINDDQRYQPQTKGAIILQADNLIQLATTTIDFTIAANDTPTISIQVNPPSLTEGATVTLTLTTNNAPNKDVTIDLTTITPDARIILPPSITLKEGETTASILLPITDDNIPQQASTYTIMLTIADNSGFAQLNNNEVSFTIEADNDLYLIGFIPSKVTLKEGTTIQATITATPNTQQDITLMLASENTQQLTISPTTVTLSADAPSKPIIIQAIADTQQESTEVYQVSIAVPTNTPAIVTTPLVVTIPPSQAPAITAQLDQNEINEGDQTFLTLTANGILPIPTTITLTTIGDITVGNAEIVLTTNGMTTVAVTANNDDIVMAAQRSATITLAVTPDTVDLPTTHTHHHHRRR